jgi:tetratricopeptide (TPR) repeat protein
VASGACGGGRQAAWETTPQPAGAKATEQEGDQLAQAKAAAQAAWSERSDEKKLREAIASYQRAVEIAPKDIESYEQLARAFYFLADGHIRFHSDANAEADLLVAFEQAVTAAEKGLIALSEPFAQKMRDGAKIEEAALTLDKTGVPLLYWRASALGKWATAKGFATLLSYKDEIKDVMQICLDKDPNYFYSGPDRYFGVFYARAPSFAGGDLAKSREHFDKSLAKEPNYFGTHVLMAEDLAVKAQDRKLFDEHIEFVLKSDPAVIPELTPENKIEQKKAELLKKQANDLFE